MLPPVFKRLRRRGAASAAPVSTVKCLEDNSLVKAALDSPGSGRVLVVDGGGSLRRALVGGNLGAAAARNGWAGVVVDGCGARRRPNWPPARSASARWRPMPLPTVKRDEGQRDVPVQVQGVWIRPGRAALYADDDGIVVMAGRALRRWPRQAHRLGRRAAAGERDRSAGRRRSAAGSMVTKRALFAAGVAVVPMPGIDWLTDVGVLMQAAARRSTPSSASRRSRSSGWRRTAASSSTRPSAPAAALLVGRVVTRDLVLRLVKLVGVRLTTQAGRQVRADRRARRCRPR
ncbi:MAG: hypothetical protein MZW92_16065 [Comamonadaceae bacterium]|nr:hypothetical protein [Comamonadaceae bacterium]